MLPSRIFPFMTDYQLSAVPLFIFMAAMLEKAGIIEELFDVIYKWLGSLKGGLASATVVACTVLAAMVGRGRRDRGHDGHDRVARHAASAGTTPSSPAARCSPAARSAS